MGGEESGPLEDGAAAVSLPDPHPATAAPTTAATAAAHTILASRPAFTRIAHSSHVDRSAYLTAYRRIGFPCGSGPQTLIRRDSGTAA
ncbi:hypothetical protein [Peterkaempfera bronchialis]|uniref:hypothetical protein n=1 Tax=Peterkaempfera bronchialis TaxID=2126346 RepID=UPI000DBBD4C1|nr:hypothetical protein [Peterkaempfera bronchialis]